MKALLSRFEKKYGHLKQRGLIIDGLTNIKIGLKIDAINVSRPFIFDNRLMLNTFEGKPVKRKVYGQLPEEFRVKKTRKRSQPKEYIWTPDRFEHFVDRCADEIREKLENPTMTRDAMLDALCFGDFKAHKQYCDRRVEEGTIQPYEEAAPEADLEEEPQPEND